MASGWRQTGWLVTGGGAYYLNNNGEMVTGSQAISGLSYTFAPSGELVAVGQAKQGGYGPKEQITWAETAAMLVNAFYPEELARAVVPARSPWYAPHLQIAQNRGILINPPEIMHSYLNSGITRFDFVRMMVQILDDKLVCLSPAQRTGPAGGPGRFCLLHRCRIRLGPSLRHIQPKPF